MIIDEGLGDERWRDSGIVSEGQIVADGAETALALVDLAVYSYRP
jgi:hypothetical protein